MRNGKKTASCHKNGFHYCAWAKGIVAIGALPLIALTAASLARQPFWQAVLGLLAVAGAVRIAIWIDRIPLLQKNICPRQPQHKA